MFKKLRFLMIANRLWQEQLPVDELEAAAGRKP
jgi:hypothetical protein